MKPIGVIGGIGPESTIDYYRAMIAAYRERQPDGSYPAIVISSVDAGALLGAADAAASSTTVRRVLVAELERLARAGAGCAIIAANSPHVVFDELQRRSPLPLVSIVEATALEAVRLACRRLGAVRHPLDDAGALLSGGLRAARARAGRARREASRPTSTTST